VVLIAAAIWATYALFTSRYTGANDFYPRWVGTCALLREGLDPYSETTTRRIQQGVYGRLARPDEDQVAFAYPLYASLFVWPTCITNHYPLAQAIWLWMLLGASIVAAALSLQAVGWRPRPARAVLTVLWALLLYPSFRALILGQLAVFVLLALALMIWAIQRGRYGWSGVFLALSLVKPQLVCLAVPWVLFWAAARRRWRVWGGFAVTLALLALVPMVLLPSWILSFVRQALVYPSYTVYGSLTWIIVRGLGLGLPAEIAAQAILAVLALGLAWRFRKGSREQMLWVLGILLLLTNFFVPRIATTNYITLLPWIFWTLFEIQQSDRRLKRWAQAGIAAVLLAVPWITFLLTLEGDVERTPAYIPFPAVVTALLAWLGLQIIRRSRD